MAEGEKTFRFLTDAEFLALSEKDRALYLVRAAHELELRQRQLRAHVQKAHKEKPE